MITIFCWNAAQKKGYWLQPDAFRARVSELAGSSEVVWIDLSNPTEEEEQLVFRDFFPIHFLSLEDITRMRREGDALDAPHFPKVEEFPDYLFVIVNPLSERTIGRLHRRPEEATAGIGRIVTQLSAVVTPRVLITHHYEGVVSIEELRSYLSKHAECAERGPDYLFHLVLDSMVDQYAPALDHIDETLDDVERRIFIRPTQRLLMRLMRLKRGITSLRKTLIYEREVLSRLSRGEFALIEARETVYYRNVYDHLVRFTELIESSRELVHDLMETHLASMSNRLNEIMKVLAMISTIILPMTLIAGIYGMNFDNMPEFHWEWGFLWALGLMALAGASSLVFFRWRKWI